MKATSLHHIVDQPRIGEKTMALESRDNRFREKTEIKQEIGTAIGVAIGLAYGAAIHNVGVGLVVGAAAGTMSGKSMVPLAGFLLLTALTWAYTLFTK